jgi:hypothetical protein
MRIIDNDKISVRFTGKRHLVQKAAKKQKLKEHTYVRNVTLAQVEKDLKLSTGSLLQ